MRKAALLISILFFVNIAFGINILSENYSIDASVRTDGWGTDFTEGPYYDEPEPYVWIGTVFIRGERDSASSSNSSPVSASLHAHSGTGYEMEKWSLDLDGGGLDQLLYSTGHWIDEGEFRSTHNTSKTVIDSDTVQFGITHIVDLFSHLKEFSLNATIEVEFAVDEYENQINLGYALDNDAPMNTFVTIEDITTAQSWNLGYDGLLIDTVAGHTYRLSMVQDLSRLPPSNIYDAIVDLTVAPEPATISLFALGSLALRRRKQ